jgi:hypothetical protein
MVAHREALLAARVAGGPSAPLVPALAAANQHLTAVCINRHPRWSGPSGYSAHARLRLAVRGLLLLTPWRHTMARRDLLAMGHMPLVITVDRRTRASHDPTQQPSTHDPQRASHG